MKNGSSSIGRLLIWVFQPVLVPVKCSVSRLWGSELLLDFCMYRAVRVLTYSIVHMVSRLVSRWLWELTTAEDHLLVKDESIWLKKRKGKEKVTLEDCPHVIWQWSDLVILSLGHVLIRGRKYLANVSPINRLQFTLLDHNPRAFLKSFTLYANSLYLHLIPHLDIEPMPWSSESIPGIQSLTVPHHICLLGQRSLHLRKHKLVGCFRLVCPAPNVFGTRIWILEHRSCDMLSLIFRAILSES